MSIAESKEIFDDVEQELKTMHLSSDSWQSDLEDEGNEDQTGGSERPAKQSKKSNDSQKEKIIQVTWRYLQ